MSRNHPTEAIGKHLENLKLIVIVSCHNEEGNIHPFLSRTEAVVSGYDYRVIFVDDGSTDGTLNVLKALAATRPRINYLSLSRNFGQQMALKAGYDHALYADCVVCMDADLQHPPEAIPAMVDKWAEGYEVVCGVRREPERGATSFWNRLTSRLFYRLINRFADHAIIPNAPDFRLLDGQVVKALSGFREQGLYLKGIIPWMGYRQATVMFDVGVRQHGHSRYSPLKLLSLSMKAFVSGSIAPLRLSMALGAVFAGLSFCYGFYALYMHLFTDETVAGWTSIIASILFIAGIQFLLMGVMGEYIGRTLAEARGRPPYLIREGNISTGSKVP